MTFDASQPANTTKIRNLGTVIRPNWEAIEQGDDSFIPYSLNLYDRSNGPPPASDDPDYLEAAYKLYCKQDDEGNPELFARNILDSGAANNPVQLSYGSILRAVGGTSNNGETFLPGGISVKFGRSSANGQTDITYSSLSLNDFNNACFLVVSTPIEASGSGLADTYIYTRPHPSTPLTTFRALGVLRTSLSAVSVTFQFVAIGY